MVTLEIEDCYGNTIGLIEIMGDNLKIINMLNFNLADQESETHYRIQELEEHKKFFWKRNLELVKKSKD